MDWMFPYINLPWIDRSTTESSMATGFDCQTLIQDVFLKQHGIKLKELEYNVATKSAFAVSRALANKDNFEEWRVLEDSEEIRDFDVAVFSMRKKGNHLGLVISDGYLHSLQTMGVIYTSPLFKIEALGFKLDYYIRFKDFD